MGAYDDFMAETEGHAAPPPAPVSKAAPAAPYALPDYGHDPIPPAAAPKVREAIAETMADPGFHAAPPEAKRSAILDTVNRVLRVINGVPNPATPPAPAPADPNSVGTTPEDREMLAKSGLSRTQRIGYNTGVIPTPIAAAGAATLGAIPGLRGAASWMTGDPYFADPSHSWNEKRLHFGEKVEGVRNADPGTFDAGRRDAKSDLLQVGTALAAGPVARGGRLVSAGVGAAGNGAAALAGTDPDAPLPTKIKNVALGAASGAAAGFGAASPAGAGERVTNRNFDSLADFGGKKVRTDLTRVRPELIDLMKREPEIIRNASNAKGLEEGSYKILQARGKEAAELYGSADADKGGGPRFGDTLKAVDARIAELSKTGTGVEVARRLEKLKQNLIAAHGDNPDARIPSATLRKEQTDHQAIGYPGKTDSAKDAVTKKAAQEMSKVLGDQVSRHVTGMSYADAAKLAAKEPDSTAGHMLKLNDDIAAASALNKAAKERLKNEPTGENNRAKELVASTRGTTANVVHGVSKVIRGGGVVDRGLSAAIKGAGSAIEAGQAVKNHIFGTATPPPGGDVGKVVPTRLGPGAIPNYAAPMPPAGPTGPVKTDADLLREDAEGAK